MATVVDIRQPSLDLDPVVNERCEERLRIARTHMAAGFYHWLEAGKQFAAIKEALGSRHWRPWITAHKDVVSYSTANVLVSISERFDPILLVASNIEPLELHLDFEALRLLASPSVTAPVAEAAVEKASAGEHITEAKAKEMVEIARKEAALAAVTEAREATAAELEEAASQVRQYRASVETLNAELTELKKGIDARLKVARDEAAAAYRDKLVFTDAELEEHVRQALVPATRLVEAEQTRYKRLEKERDRLEGRIERLEETLKKAKASPGAPPPQFDSTTSFRAMCIMQALEALAKELKITARQCVDIERTRDKHFQVDAGAKSLAAALTNAKAISKWVGAFVVAVSGEDNA